MEQICIDAAAVAAAGAHELILEFSVAGRISQGRSGDLEAGHDHP
jgi:hypothetical protein